MWIWAFELGNMDGTLSVDVSNGNIPKASPGVGRLFGLASIAELPRRMSFDFNDVFGKGFGFDSIKGDFKLGNGNAYTDNLKIHGPAAEIKVTGRTGLRARDSAHRQQPAGGRRGSGRPDRRRRRVGGANRARQGAQPRRRAALSHHRQLGQAGDYLYRFKPAGRAGKFGTGAGKQCRAVRHALILVSAWTMNIAASRCRVGWTRGRAEPFTCERGAGIVAAASTARPCGF